MLVQKIVYAKNKVYKCKNYNIEIQLNTVTNCNITLSSLHRQASTSEEAGLACAEYDDQGEKWKFAALSIKDPLLKSGQ